MSLILPHLDENKSNFDLRKCLKVAAQAISEICKARYQSFGSEGMADKIITKSLESIQDFYGL